MSFSKLSFTNAGRALQAKALAGTPLVFTKIALGSGSLNGRDPATFTSLLESKVSISISKTTREGQQVTLEANFSNQDNNTGFYWREVGLFANDPTLGEILYCYGNAGNVAEYIQPSTSSSIEKVITLTAVVGNAQNVTAIINTAAFATKKDISAMTMSLSEVNSKLAQTANIQFVKEEIAKAQLEGAGVDTSNFVVQSDLQESNVRIENTYNAIGRLSLNMKDITGGYENFYYNNGNRIDKATSSRSYVVTGGEVIKIEMTSLIWIDIYVFLSSNGDVLSYLRAGSTSPIIIDNLIVPTGAVKLICSTQAAFLGDIKVTKYYTKTDDVQNELTNLSKSVDTRFDFYKNDVALYNEISPIYITGSYVKSDGWMGTSSNFEYTAPILLKKDHKIVIYAEGYLATVSILALTNQSGDLSRKTPLVVSTDSKYKKYEYVSDRDIYVTISTTMRSGCKIYITEFTVRNDYIDTNLYETKENFRNVFYNSSYAKLINKALFGGDSITAGYRKSGYTDAKKSYPNYLAQMCEFELCDVIAQPGITTMGWWTDKAKTKTYTNYEVVFLKLGQNGGLTDTIDIDCVGTTYEDYAMTNTGCYCKIIEYITEQNPKIKIFLITTHHSHTTDNLVISKIVDKYSNCYLIDINNHPYFNVDDNKYHVSNTGISYDVHFNTIGNMALAKVIYDLLCDCIVKNVVDFYDF